MRGQQTLLESRAFQDYARLEHGGSVRKGKRKLMRPFDSKRPMHVVLRSSRARGAWSFLQKKNARWVRLLTSQTGKKFGVRLHDFANGGNHLHLLVSAKNRRGFQAFARTLPALVARRMTGAKKGQPKGKFWDALYYSRVVNWGREFVAVRKYLLRNRLEALGYLGQEDRWISIDLALKAAADRSKRPFG